MPVSRRELIGRTLGLAGAVALAPLAAAADARSGTPITRVIPATGERIPVVGIGSNAYDVTSAADLAPLREVLREMPLIGGRLIDSARGYGRSEAVIGQLLGELGNRDRYFIATKAVSAPQADAKIDRALIDESFNSLRVKVIDLMQVHSLVRIDDVLPLYREYKQDKRIRYIGATTAAPRQHAQFLEVMRKAPLDFVQVDYSIANRAAAEELLPLAQERGMAVINNMPFGGRNGSLFPRLAGKPVPAWAAEFGAVTWAQFLLKYNLSHPAITCAIPGTTNLTHLRDNQAAGRGALPDAALRRRMEQHWDSL
jgi:aryl-alcohol dehydrogenase-like predicted oxidoreductase